MDLSIGERVHTTDVLTDISIYFFSPKQETEKFTPLVYVMNEMDWMAC